MKLKGAKRIEIRVWADLDFSHFEQSDLDSDKFIKSLEQELHSDINKAINSLEGRYSLLTNTDWECGTDIEGEFKFIWKTKTVLP